jgi:hypothetical protein
LEYASFSVCAIRYARRSGRTSAGNHRGNVDFHDAACDLDYYIRLVRHAMPAKAAGDVA